MEPACTIPLPLLSREKFAYEIMKHGDKLNGRGQRRGAAAGRRQRNGNGKADPMAPTVHTKWRQQQQQQAAAPTRARWPHLDSRSTGTCG